MTILVTGGAGFIGSNFVIEWLNNSDEDVVTLDALTYAGHIENLEALKANRLHTFVQGDIRDTALVTRLLKERQPRAIVNFAAESHVDRSIAGPAAFIDTNIVGTFNLLECALQHVRSLEASASQPSTDFRFLHVSTDEVYGSLGPDDAAFTEEHPFQPNSPYAASKAASDHLVRSYHRTYGLPVVTTNCSNNYGPRQYPEKLIPLVVCNALEHKKLPVYGGGDNVRDWLYVTDHCAAVRSVLERGAVGETYNIGGGTQKANIDTVKTVCALLDEMRPRADGRSYAEQIAFVEDRAGHDKRYAVDIGKIEQELGWQPSESFETGLRKTVAWYLDNPGWIKSVLSVPTAAAS